MTPILKLKQKSRMSYLVLSSIQLRLVFREKDEPGVESIGRRLSSALQTFFQR